MVPRKQEGREDQEQEQPNKEKNRRSPLHGSFFDQWRRLPVEGGSIPFISDWCTAVGRRYQHFLDKTTPFVLRRWAALFVVAFVYVLRVGFFVQGFYVVSYGLGIYILNLFIAFLSPQVDPEIQDLINGGGDDNSLLPTKSSDEFRPFVRRLPEFKFWHSLLKAFCIAFIMTFFSLFDVPVFWPILLFYWVVLFTVTMKRQILHMIKYRYVPFSFGKQRYTGKKASVVDDLDNASKMDGV